MMSGEQKTPVVFTGRTGEYFGIWIVNLLLSILTLGIYSAWAKVRRKKYFYQHTFIDGVAFDYHASPVAILKGRFLAFGLFVLYSISAEISPVLSGVFIIAFIIFLPWIIVRSLTFNARNSSYRGLRFDFKGRLWDAVLYYILLPILMVLTLGLLYPFISQRRNRFLAEGHRFGRSPFIAGFKVKDFYFAYLKALLLLVGLLLAAGLSIGLLNVNNTDAWAKESMQQAIVPLIFIYLLILTICGAFLRARLLNLVWSGTRVEHVGFSANLRSRDLVWLYATNLLLIVLSLGLLTPWAQIRTMRYHAERLSLVGETDFAHFVGEKKAEVKAAGEEIGEMFDVELALG
ncbi:YjgN family protein [Methylobacillus sp. Pita2]|uniref:YjgN family protein n=1 Tax=Methylobacillus sp. Pita2 TaxID=3383245 RepID=UPI0038B5BE57